MKRTLAFSAIFAATLGLASLAQAQTAPNQVYGPAQRYETAGKPSAGQQAAPSTATSPAVPSNSNPYWRSSVPGMTNPQQTPNTPTNP